MTYDDPSLSEFRGYFQAKEPGRRERAEAWANYADYPRGVKREWGYLEAFFRNLLLGEKNELKSRYLLIGIDRPPPRFGEGDASQVVRKSGKKMVERVWELLRDQPQLTFVGMVAALGITRSTIQKHIAHLKAAGRLRRIGPDKGGHWEVL